jgi:UDP-glucose 4-epimerase
MSILALAERVIALAGSKSAIEFQTYTQAYDADFEDIRRRVPDLARIRATIDYRPKFDVDDIIRDVIASRRSAQ